MWSSRSDAANHLSHHETVGVALSQSMTGSGSDMSGSSMTSTILASTMVSLPSADEGGGCGGGGGGGDGGGGGLGGGLAGTSSVQ